MDDVLLSRAHTCRQPRLSVRAVACLLSTTLLSAPASAQKPAESDVKATYLLSFGKFLRQPETPEIADRKTFDICLLGRDDLGGVFAKPANDQINGLPERVLSVPNSAAAKTCAILFISASETEHIADDLADLEGSPVLTVSDMPHFLDRGGMIAFEIQDNRVRFSVALDAVNKAGLGLSSELLRVALDVTGQPQRGGQ